MAGLGQFLPAPLTARRGRRRIRKRTVAEHTERGRRIDTGPPQIVVGPSVSTPTGHFLKIAGDAGACPDRACSSVSGAALFPTSLGASAAVPGVRARIAPGCNLGQAPE